MAKQCIKDGYVFDDATKTVKYASSRRKKVVRVSTPDGRDFDSVVEYYDDSADSDEIVNSILKREYSGTLDEKWRQHQREEEIQEELHRKAEIAWNRLGYTERQWIMSNDIDVRRMQQRLWDLEHALDQAKTETAMVQAQLVDRHANLTAAIQARDRVIESFLEIWVAAGFAARIQNRLMKGLIMNEPLYTEDEVVDFAATIGQGNNSDRSKRPMPAFDLAGPFELEVGSVGKKRRSLHKHIGGEQFTFFRAMIHEDGQMAVLFKPVTPEGYEFAEVQEDEIPKIFGYHAYEALQQGLSTYWFKDRAERQAEADKRRRAAKVSAEIEAKGGKNKLFGMF